MIYAGIDWSMSSPCIMIDNLDTDRAQFSRVFHYLTTVRKAQGQFRNMYGHEMRRDFTSDQQRFDWISSWGLDILQTHNVDRITLEDYAYAASGRVFHIAENTGLLKHKLWQNGMPFKLVTPTEVKKFATGKGNAKKDALQEAYVAETGVDIKAILGLTPKQWNPSSDIIDSYYICKLGVEAWHDHT